MKRLSLALAIALSMILAVQMLARADGPSRTLLPGTKVEYRFDYRGDGSQIQVGLDSYDADLLTLSIYTPAQMDAVRRGETVTPVGRGMPSREHDLFWAGGFKIAGVYHAIVESRATAPVLYQVQITGDSVSGTAEVFPVAAPIASNIVAGPNGKNLIVDLPVATKTRLSLAMPGEPVNCTHSNQVPGTIAQSIKLCPNEIYQPMKVVGNNIGIFTDNARTAVITSVGRQFAITMEGNRNWIEGVTIQAQADPQDAGAWLCLYDECVFPTQPISTTLHGSVAYGGGVLLKGTNSVVHAVTVRGGTVGIATVDGRANYLVDNQLNELNGWGSYNLRSVSSYFVGNTWNRENHACTSPDGRKFLHGCETSGWVCLGCQANFVVRNHCELSANCYYMSGERGLANIDNRLIGNYCAGASDNCIEITFSQRNVLEQNVSTVHPETDTSCRYPFWIGGSVVFFKDNTWQCTVTADDAFNQARDSTIVATNIINIDAYDPAPGLPTFSVAPTRVPLPAWGLDFVH